MWPCGTARGVTFPPDRAATRRHHERHRQAGLLPAHRRAELRPRGRPLLGPGGAAEGDHPDLRGLPRLPHVLQVLRQLSRPLRPPRQEARRGRPQDHRRRDREGDGRLLPVQAVRGAVSLHPPRRPRVPAGLSEAGAPLQGPGGEEEGRAAQGPGPRRPGRLRPDGSRQPRDGQRHEPGEGCTGSSWRPPWGSTGTSCCPTSPRRPSSAGRRGRAAFAGPRAWRPCSSRPATCRTTSPRSVATPWRSWTGTRSPPPVSRACSAAGCPPGSRATSTRSAGRPPTT